MSYASTGSSYAATTTPIKNPPLAITVPNLRHNNKALKCVLLGDGAVGKTSLIISYTTNGYPTEYQPTAYDKYSVRVRINEDLYKLEICDTAGQDDFDEIRRCCYVKTDVILVCFSVVRPVSLSNIRDKWLPEIKKFLPKIPILLVGTQSDLRDDLDVLVDLARYNQKPVHFDDATKFAKRNGFVDYVECSALTQKNLKEVFDVAITEAKYHNDKQKNKRHHRRRMRRKNKKHNDDHTTVGRVRRKSAVWWKKLLCLTAA